MAPRQGRPVLITITGNDGDERVVWNDCTYDQVFPIPLAWGLWRYAQGLSYCSARRSDTDLLTHLALSRRLPTTLPCGM
jgi:hypothetical protein